MRVKGKKSSPSHKGDARRSCKFNTEAAKLYKI